MPMVRRSKVLEHNIFFLIFFNVGIRKSPHLFFNFKGMRDCLRPKERHRHGAKVFHLCNIGVLRKRTSSGRQKFWIMQQMNCRSPASRGRDSYALFQPRGTPREPSQ
jgi:hypothetical protein